MATFANHSSNLRALKSVLHSYSDVLVVDQEKTQDETIDLKNASSFLEEQRRRVDSIDESLLQATDDILPANKDAKTITELAELCHLVQEATRQKLSLLRTRLELMGVKTAWGETVTSPLPAAKEESNSQIQWSIGGPLECVVEGDVETEGTTTPGSWLHPSPFASAGKSRKSLTPNTPTMKTFTFSANTTSILEKMNMDKMGSTEKRRSSLKGMKQSPAASGRRLSSHTQPNFDGFQSDDDMISLATTVEESQSAFNKTNTMIKSSPRIQQREDRSQFLARMESMLERVEEELIHENRPSDETSGFTRSTSPSHDHRRPSNNKFLEELEEEESSVDDDSTNVVATKVASVGSPDKPVPLPLQDQTIVKPIAIHRRPTQIVVDTTIASPAHTNLTFDVTMMNDTMASMSILADEDNMSTVTPILDRYRLDPDDNSIGIKVVPNQRGSHKDLKTNLASVSEMESETMTKLTPEYVSDKDGFMSPKGLPGTVSARKKQYRRTPFPKKQLERSFESIDSENDHPNLQRMLSPNSSLSLADSSLSVPPLRPKSFGPATTSTRKTVSQSRALSLHM